MRKINTRDFSRGTRTTSREVNRQIVLNLVREHQPISRAELARRMGVARGVVGPIVNELLAEELIGERAAKVVVRGRRPRLLHVRTRDRLALAVDLRFSQTTVRLSDFADHEVARVTFATPRAPAAVVEALAAVVKQLQAAHVGAGTCEGVGLAVPGMVDHHTGRILHAPTLGWRDVDLREPLEAALQLPVHVDRDAVACALAQVWLGERGADPGGSFVYVTVSDGVGTGLVVNGEVVRGHSDAAGEFGHVPLNLDGPPCLCGARGCLEAYTSDLATIARYFGLEPQDREEHARLRKGGFSVREIVSRARGGEARALEALEATSRYLGVGVAVIVNALNPGRIIIGGEIASAWEIVEPVLRAQLAARALTAATAATPIDPEPEDEETRLRGAAALVVAPLFAAPQVA